MVKYDFYQSALVSLLWNILKSILVFIIGAKKIYFKSVWSFIHHTAINIDRYNYLLAIYFLVAGAGFEPTTFRL
jgi:hypothetical protein